MAPTAKTVPFEPSYRRASKDVSGRARGVDSWLLVAVFDGAQKLKKT